MAHWWELWSPGLQALGVGLLLVGAGLLAYEWRRSGESIKAALPKNAHTQKTESEYALMIFSATRHRKTYQIGYALVGIGAILQMGATAIGWLISRGYF